MYDYEDYYEPSMMDEIFREATRKLTDALKEAAAAKVSIVYQENTLFKTQNEKLLTDVRKLNEEICVQKVKSENAMEEARKELLNDMFVGLTCGQKLWTVKVSEERDTCPHCSGKAHVNVDVFGIIKKVDCPHCSWNGKVVIDKTFTPLQRIVESVTVETWNRGRCLKISGGFEERDDDKTFYDKRGDDSEEIAKNFFFTEEECMEECKRLEKEYSERLDDKNV